MEIVVCEKCGISRNVEEAKECPLCEYGKPDGKPKEFGFGLRTGIGGPKKKVHKCPKCGHEGFVVRNPAGGSANCGECGKRVY